MTAKSPRIAPLGELVDLHTEQINPGAYPDTVYEHYSIPAYDAGPKAAIELGADIKSNKFTLPKGAILLSKLNPRINRVWTPDTSGTRPAVTSTEFLVLKPRPGLDRRFIHYLLRSPAFRAELSSRVTGTSGSHQRVRPLDALAIPIAVPPLETQQAISNVLGCLDDKIELNRRMSETLEQIARELYKAWFIDFTAGPTANQEVTGELPNCWTYGSLADVSELSTESWNARSAPDTVEYLDLSNIKWGRILGSVNYEWNEAPSRARRILRSGDTVVGTVRPGNGSYALITHEGLTGSTGLAVLRPKAPITRALTYLAATDSSNIERLAHLADGAAYPAVRPSVVHESPVTVPDPDTLLAFSTTVDPVLDRISACEAENETLAALRDTLLPKLISGELRVPEAEQLVSEAV